MQEKRLPRGLEKPRLHPCGLEIVMGKG